MIDLFEDELNMPERRSSKGNQLKWSSGEIWYKADYAGYEGAAEYVVCKMLEHTNLNSSEYAHYEIEQFRYKKSVYTGVKSENFIHEDWQLITLERLFRLKYNESLMKAVWSVEGAENRVEFLVDQVEKMTGIHDFGSYITKLLTIDAVFLNEDRHMHNIAVLINGEGNVKLCPIFDHGASLMSDTTMDYPMGIDVISAIGDVEAKTICSDFDEALDAAEKLYGNQIKWNISRNEAETIIDSMDVYAIDVKTRIKDIVFQQMRKYSYLFN